MEDEKLSFVKTGLFTILEGLSGDSKNTWGKMNAQQMVEHATDFFNVSTEKIRFDLVTPEEHLPKFKEFLMSDKAFRENTKAPASVIGEEPLPLRQASLQDAKAALRQAVDEFIAFFEKDPERKTTHPVFGPLNFNEWTRLHYKHMQHHMKQFGLL